MTWLGEKQTTPLPGGGSLEAWAPIVLGWFAITVQRITTAKVEAISLCFQIVRER